MKMLEYVQLPDGDTRVVGHTAGHCGFGAFDDALVLRRIGYAGPSWRQSDHNKFMLTCWTVIESCMSLKEIELRIIWLRIDFICHLHI